MCFNASVSLFTFMLGTAFSLILIKYGNPKYKKENSIFGIFFLFISAIQGMEYLMWIDLKNKMRLNEIMTLLFPLINTGQPILLYLIKFISLKLEFERLQKVDIFVLLLNLIYLFQIIYNYIKFLLQGEHITKVKNGHLSWPWLKFANPLFYLILFAIDIFYLTDFQYSFSLFFMTYLFLFISYNYFHYNVGELWCFFGSFIPLILFFLSKYFFQ
jgi:hypothetical protein